MTLGGAGRGTAGRGSVGRGPAGRDDRRLPAATDPWSAAVEVEELPPQRVATRGRAGLGLGGAIAAGAAVVLLAAGLGFWGGRPQATPPAVADGTIGVPTAVPVFTGEPLATPELPCGDSPSGPPGVLLGVGGRSTMGSVEVVDRRPGASPGAGTLAEIPFAVPPPRVDVPSDIVAQVWTAGRVCAVGWKIQVVGDGLLDLLGFVDNPDRLPAFASQNRFGLVLVPYEGQDLDLRATLVFQDFTVRATWPIRVLPFTRPAGTFTARRTPLPTLEGCDVELTLGNGWVSRPNTCGTDIVEDPGTPTAVQPGQKLVFKFDQEGWQIDDATVACGQLVIARFVVDRACRLQDPARDQFSATLTAPKQSGVFALAVQACGTQELADATNRLCGTWYANLEERG